MNRDEILNKITKFYLESSDFNGISLKFLLAEDTKREALPLLKELLREELVATVFGDRHPNPHIRALPEHHSPGKQAELLDTSLVEHACAYPLPKHLEMVVDQSLYAGRPYALALALGEPQLTHRAFDPIVLETYRNDPRYHYDCDDVQGSISVHGKHYESDSMATGDKVFLQAFGFAYDGDFNKYVAVFLWDLFRLSPEHQRLWQIREVRRTTNLHPDYYRTAILGDWPEKVSIYQAFIEELQVINRMAAAMGRAPLFRNGFSKEGRPREFSSLLRPTAREFNSFVQLLDKLMSDNINVG